MSVQDSSRIARPDAQPAVAIVGAGFSGAMTALHLASLLDGPRVYLFDRPGPFGRGAAYSAIDPDHLLNVRTANMSALPDEPDHFARWLAETTGQSDGSFARRSDYGRYLQSLLANLAQSAEAVDRLVIAPDEVTAVRPDGAVWQVETAMGRRIAVDAVCLAIGNLAPHHPEGLDERLDRSPAYVADPWAWNPDRVSPEARTALLVGAGLTMVDVALALNRRRPDLRITALSRRGLVPNAHEGEPAELDIARPFAGPAAVARALRRLAVEYGWRTAVDAVRPHVQEIWRRWSDVDRRRFLRHGRAYWDVHRHRLAPPVAHRLDFLRRDDQLTIQAGSLTALRIEGEEVAATWRPRGSRDTQTGHFDLVVNCTGPTGDITVATSPLLRHLVADGRARPDPLGLGADCDADGRLLGRDGRPTPGLFAVGPITRGALWEITAVPDIRVQARNVATALAVAVDPTRRSLSTPDK